MEILPTSIAEYIFSAVFIIIGILLFSYMLGEIANLIDLLRSRSAKFNRDMDQIITTMIIFSVPDFLQHKILSHFKKSYKFFTKNEDLLEF